MVIVMCTRVNITECVGAQILLFSRCDVTFDGKHARDRGAAATDMQCVTFSVVNTECEECSGRWSDEESHTT